VSWWARIEARIEALRTDSDRRWLDYGCGVGRFSRLLAEAGFEVTGVDLAPEMVRLARAHCGELAEITLLEPYADLPFEDDSFDGLLTSAVLQHVADQALPPLVAELRRVLRPGAIVVLLENTHQGSSRLSPSGHVVFRPAREYATHFPGLRALEEFEVEGQVHTLLAGRYAG
jgi:ubiquinone/menaquinone biosynthesis C-methylase UbiE